MKYFDALFPSVAMAIIFTAVIVTMIRNQGGANKAKEDAVVDAAQATLREARTPSQASPRD